MSNNDAAHSRPVPSKIWAWLRSIDAAVHGDETRELSERVRRAEREITDLKALIGNATRAAQRTTSTDMDDRFNPSQD
jgi:hypothetical protein